MRLKLSVHQLVDFLLREGDIDSRIFSRSTMNEGTEIHSRYQASQNSAYLSEYPLMTDLVVDDIEVSIEGRADGIIKNGPEDYIIDEIKSTVAPLEEFYESNKNWHLGQAKVYGYMFLKEQRYDHIGIRLTYIRQGEESEKKIYDFSFSYLELEQFVIDLVSEYLDFYRLISSLREKRNEFIKALPFPFAKTRGGQQKLSKYCYGIAVKGGKLFVEAPTGIGKTVSTLFPYVKSLPLDDEAKIFYLTAKNSGKEAAEKCMDIIDGKSGNISYINITAKEKICLCKGKACNPDECPYTKGYYSKIANVIKYSLFTYHKFDYHTVLNIAEEFMVCPFELELDLSNYIDVIICDYNYVFDPISYLKRYMDESREHYLLLVDEAHNLVDRSRSMYSESLKEEDFIKMKKSLRKKPLKRLKANFAKLSKRFNALKDEYNQEYNLISSIDDLTYRILNRFIDIMNEINKMESKEITPELQDFFFNVNRFLKIYELSNDSFIIFIHKVGDLISINISCLDASKFLKGIANSVKGVTYFSATLSPIDYYVQTLGGERHLEPVLFLPSPFKKENLKIYTCPKVSVKYRNREQTYELVADYLKTFIEGKIGNYLIYLPSYDYLDNLQKVIDLPLNVDIYYQNREMNDIDKEEFLSHFVDSPTKTTVGFAVIGGAFGEGIDLVSDRLIGVAIIGIGMPRINFISDQIRDYYNENELDGYNYAYVYPGMNKVMQAIGRVIRDENDRGAVLLIDERYALNEYRDLFRSEWDEYEMILSTDELRQSLQDFYEEK
ncbi:MAG: ATP-dependent DNA helicase [Erysipelotrichaceae bacterium]|nr:ATP-dependent DNA helicase [Erysipelotrichaceae bacterium]